MATIQTTARALDRQCKRFNRAVAAMEHCESESARKRHARRMINAQRGMAQARRDYETMALCAV
jgi:hypothetical protein